MSKCSLVLFNALGISVVGKTSGLLLSYEGDFDGEGFRNWIRGKGISVLIPKDGCSVNFVKDHLVKGTASTEVSVWFSDKTSLFDFHIGIRQDEVFTKVDSFALTAALKRSFEDFTGLVPLGERELFPFVEDPSVTAARMRSEAETVILSKGKRLGAGSRSCL